MAHPLNNKDLLAVGFMTFAFFLGAGNLIFPPLAGWFAGENWWLAMIGFLITAVGMPLLSLLACAYAGGGIKQMATSLPKWAIVVLLLVIYSLLGPLFATPRAALVAYEIGMVPLADQPNETLLLIYSVVFFALTVCFAWSKGSLTKVIGRFLTPLLIACLSILALFVWLQPHSAPNMIQLDYVTTPISAGLIEGYKTMDTFSALMFGMLVIKVLQAKGIECQKQISNNLIKVSFIAALCLGALYMALFYLGATSQQLLNAPDNGGALISAYVHYLFGPAGVWVFAILVTMACITAATGLLSAFADCFHDLFPKLSYRTWLLAAGVCSVLVSNVGLSALLKLAEPILFALYPVTISLVFITLLKDKIKNTQWANQSVLGVAAVFSIPDVYNSMVIKSEQIHLLPLSELGLTWLLPSAITLLLFLSPIFNEKPLSTVNGE